MAIRVNASVNLGDVALRIDDKRMPTRETHGPQRPQGAVGPCHGSVGVGQQQERQFEFFREAGVAGGVVQADAEHARAERRELRNVIAKITRLGGAPGGVVLRVKIENNPVAVVIGQRAQLLGLVLQRKQRRGLTHDQLGGLGHG